MKALLAAVALFAVAASPALAEPLLRETPRADGTTIHWWLDRKGAAAPQGVLIVAQGSGCASAAENDNLRRASGLVPTFAVIMVEKHGVKPHDAPTDPYEGCSAEFFANHTVSQRVADYRRVLAQVAREGWWNERLVLFGGSEGGAAVALLAPQVKPDAVVVFSTAPGRRFRDSFKLAVPSPVAAMADAEFAKIAADPTNPKLFGGNSYRWWADIMDRDLTAALMKTDAPILLVQGETDQSAPVVVARRVRDDFSEAARCNLTYWELAGFDHQMRDKAGVSHLDEVLNRISAWIESRLREPRPPRCGS